VVLEWHGDDDLKALDEALLALREDNNPMLLSEYDGFCTGLIVCPERISSKEWLTRVWGSDGPPKFENMEHMQHVIDLIIGHYNRVAEMLRPPAYYGPVLTEDSRTGEVLWEFWVEGFMTAFALYPEAWKRVTRYGDDRELAAIMSLLDLSKFARTRSERSQKEKAEYDKDAPDVITDVVLELNRFAKEQPPEALFGGEPTAKWHSAKMTNAPLRAGGKIGRNDPCSCGSGRKYKKCCGAN